VLLSNILLFFDGSAAILPSSESSCISVHFIMELFGVFSLQHVYKTHNMCNADGFLFVCFFL
jgi:hypothetical protein